MPDNVNIALLGTGIYAAADYVPALLSETNKHITVHTIWSLDEVAAQGLAKKFHQSGTNTRVAIGTAALDEIIDNPQIDAVIMVLPFMIQPDLIRRFWKAGKHVLSEKPIERDVKAGLNLVEEFDRDYKGRGLIWRVAEDYDHEPIHMRARELLRDPAMGPVLYWDFQNQNYCPDGDKWQATSWRTKPDYQGGFCLDGGVHSAALLRVILPHPPAAVVSSASLHRKHLPPHDTIVALVLPGPDATTPPSGTPTKLKVTSQSSLPAEGLSSPAGTITLSWATPGVEPRLPQIDQCLSVVCLNGKLTIVNDSGTRTLEVNYAAETGLKPIKEISAKKGVEVECAWFARAVQAVKTGKPINSEEDRGRPINMVRDVAMIQAMLSSNGAKVEIQQLIDQYRT